MRLKITLLSIEFDTSDEHDEHDSDLSSTAEHSEQRIGFSMPDQDGDT